MTRKDPLEAYRWSTKVEPPPRPTQCLEDIVKVLLCAETTPAEFRDSVRRAMPKATAEEIHAAVAVVCAARQPTYTFNITEPMIRQLHRRHPDPPLSSPPTVPIIGRR